MGKIASGDVELEVHDQGSGAPPLLLLHGFTGSSLDWTDVVGDLSTDRRLVTYDQRGHGDSTNTGDPASYTIDALVTDLAAVVDQLGLAPFDLLGHSMGGIVAMRYALARPDTLRSLILMDTFAAPTGGIPATWIDFVVGQARESGMTAVAEMFLSYIDQAPNADQLTPERREELAGRLRYKLTHMDIEALDQLGRGIGTFDSMLDSLGGIRMPVTVIVGENDAGLREPADLMAKTIPGAVLEVIPASGHSPQEDNAAAWLAAVRGHLGRAQAKA
ncbi:MAG TPA: alpha/beta fold hydrolase [Acidimicrobiales bacterium]|nr:alpha/beta fold hydrolase [Acidimicrobiales bacterium]